MQIKHIAIIQISYAVLLLVFAYVLSNTAVASGVGYNLDDYQYYNTKFFISDILFGIIVIGNIIFTSLWMLVFTIIGLVRTNKERSALNYVMGFVLPIVFHILMIILASLSVLLLSEFDTTIESIDKILLGYYILFIPILVDIPLFILFRNIYTRNITR